MAPIRVGFIGLSKAGWATTAHIPYLSSSSKFGIVAICNSSVQSAREAVELYKLPADTATYGDPEDLAKDQNVDLVVCSVRVDKHFGGIAPALKAWKNFYVEWPLGKNLEEAEELLRLSKEHGVKHTAVGFQGRFAPSVRKLKELIKGGGVCATVLGTFKTVSDVLANRRPLIQLLSKDGSVAVKDFPKTSDDTIFVHEIGDNYTPVSINLRGGKAFKSTPGQDWRIYGETGEICLTASEPFLQVGYRDIAIAVHDFASNEVEEIDIGNDPFGEFNQPVRNVARVYKAIAAGDTSILCDFEDAVERHHLIDATIQGEQC